MAVEEPDDRIDVASDQFWTAALGSSEHVSLPEALIIAARRGRIRRGPVQPGTHVRAGRVLGNLEASGSVTPVVSPTDGAFIGWLAWEGEVVGQGAIVARIMPGPSIDAGPRRWTPRSSRPRLTRREVHVWRGRLGRTSEVEALAVLDSAERVRMATLSAWRRHETVSARVLLRRILSLYLERAPSEIALRIEPGGKPALQDGELRFNLSHSAGLAVIAVHADAEVGIDIEHVRPVERWQAVARRTLGARTVEAIADLAVSERPAAFLERWTESEAALKVVGTGVTAVSAAASSAALDSCSTIAFHPAAGWVGTVAVAGPPCKTRWMEFHPRLASKPIVQAAEG